MSPKGFFTSTAQNGFEFVRNDLLSASLYRLLRDEKPEVMNSSQARAAWAALSYAEFADFIGCREPASFFLVHNRAAIEDEGVHLSQTASLEDVLAPGAASTLHLMKPVDQDVRRGLNDLAVGTTRQFERLGDLPGLNALVRLGLVKQFRLAGGRSLVLKRSNPGKRGRLLNEMRVLERLMRLIGPDPIWDQGQIFGFTLVAPEAVLRDSASDEMFLVSLYRAHPTLEVELLATDDREFRRRLLQACRWMRDQLFDRGVLWGDMAPRNILFERRGDGGLFHILDFEKSEIQAGGVPPERRRSHARGPVYVEEFGAVCTFDEVIEAFGDLFEPDAWNTDSLRPIRLEKPKREVVDVLKALGRQLEEGAYNRTEREILPVRFPFQGRSGRLRHPLHLSFKVDHYFGADADRALTLTMIKAHDFGLLEETLEVFEQFVRRYENELVLSDIGRRLEVAPSAAASTLGGVIVRGLFALETIAPNATAFAGVIDNLASALHAPEAVSPVPARNLRSGETLEALRLLADDILQPLPAHDYALFVGGSVATGTMGAGSDIDLVLLCPSKKLATTIRATLTRHIDVALGRDVEWSIFKDWAEVNRLLEESPAELFEVEAWAPVAGEAFRTAEAPRRASGGVRSEAREAAIQGLLSAKDAAPPKSILKVLLAAEARGVAELDAAIEILTLDKENIAQPSVAEQDAASSVVRRAVERASDRLRGDL